jgi:hypothetical protein
LAGCLAHACWQQHRAAFNAACVKLVENIGRVL